MIILQEDHLMWSSNVCFWTIMLAQEYQRGDGNEMRNKIIGDIIA
jgi:hypothetical protein